MLSGDKNPHEPGAKDDGAKPDLDLVLGAFSKALIEVGKVGTFGAKKYSDNGWKKVPDAQRRYLSAMQRHYCTYKDDELYDPETNLSHLAHTAWNALAALYFELEKVRVEPECRRQDTLSVFDRDVAIRNINKLEPYKCEHVIPITEGQSVKSWTP